MLFQFMFRCFPVMLSIECVLYLENIYPETTIKLHVMFKRLSIYWFRCFHFVKNFCVRFLNAYKFYMLTTCLTCYVVLKIGFFCVSTTCFRIEKYQIVLHPYCNAKKCALIRKNVNERKKIEFWQKSLPSYRFKFNDLLDAKM